jgi:1-deoxy-D-xylulose-5-phosphate reductoisomerase
VGLVKSVTVIGSTGSIGENTLRVIDELGDSFRVVGLAAGKSVERLADQTARYRPERVAIADSSSVEAYREALRVRGAACPEIRHGPGAAAELAEGPGSDIVVSAAVGAAGLEPTWRALRSGIPVALANKEALVVGGELLGETARRTGAAILPVDSEHSAIDQCLRAGRSGEVRRLILTASGGPFLRTPPARFESITPPEALEHPTWRMGPRITIDSATMMNKGLEVIEARWLFGLPASAIDIVVHPQSIVHSMVEFIDGSVVAQLGSTDMRGPIQYALTWPDRLPSALPPLDWGALPALEFELPDRSRFPALELAYRALAMGGTGPAALNAADEVAVGCFLEGRIAFQDIPRIVGEVLEAHDPRPADSVEGILEADRRAREETLQRASGPRTGQPG